MEKETIRRYYWSSRGALHASRLLYGLDAEESTKLLDISKRICQKLQSVTTDEGEAGDEIRDEIQRYVDEIRAETGDK